MYPLVLVGILCILLVIIYKTLTAWRDRSERESQEAVLELARQRQRDKST